MSSLSILKFRGESDHPLYNRDPGFLPRQTNMVVAPSGALRMRAGTIRCAPTGGQAGTYPVPGIPFLYSGCTAVGAVLTSTDVTAFRGVVLGMVATGTDDLGAAFTRTVISAGNTVSITLNSAVTLTNKAVTFTWTKVGYVGGHASANPWGWFRCYYNNGGSTYFTGFMNQALVPYPYMTTGSSGYLLFGADQPFSSVQIPYETIFANTATYYYGTADGSPPTYSALSMTESLPAGPVSRTTGTQCAYANVSWKLPTNWVPTTEGDPQHGYSKKYWMRITGVAINSSVVMPTGQWAGSDELYVASASPQEATQSMVLSQYGENNSAVSWFDLGTGAYTAAAGDVDYPLERFFAGASERARMASFFGRLVVVSGRDTKTWNGGDMRTLGLAAPDISASGLNLVLTSVPAGGPTWTGLASPLIFRYRLTYNYGVQTLGVDDLPTVAPFSGQSRTFVPTIDGEGPASEFAQISVADANYVRIEIGAGAGNQPPAGILQAPGATNTPRITSINVYRTNDLTGVSASGLDLMPYFRIMTLFPTAGVWTCVTGSGNEARDQRIDHPDPQMELRRYDPTPPYRCRYVWTSGNRLWLAGSPTNPSRVWWSDPYVMDRFDQDNNFEDFAGDGGARITGGIAFQNQSLVFTEDSVHVLTDVNSDDITSYPLSTSVGCIAPDSISVGDGVVMWLAKDGVYLWTGDGPPTKISYEKELTFNRMSFMSHGGSRGVITDHQYQLWLMTPTGTVPQDGSCFSLETQTWSTITYNMPALCVAIAKVRAPLGCYQEAREASLLGPIPGTNSNARLYLGERKTTDDTASIGCSATTTFGPGGFNTFAPSRILYYYATDDGWDATSISIQQLLGADGTWIGYSPYAIPQILGSTITDGNLYSLIQGSLGKSGSGAQGVTLSFYAGSQDGGVERNQYLLAGYLDGQPSVQRRP